MKICRTALVFAALLFLFVLSTSGNATMINANMTVDNAFEFYISTNDSDAGTIIGSRGGSTNEWYTISSYTGISLTPNQTYYIHVKATDYGVIAGFIGDFSLSDSGFKFANGTQKLVTNTTDWKAYTDGFGVTPAGPLTLSTAMGGTGLNPSWPWGGFTEGKIDPNAQWIWTGNGVTNRGIASDPPVGATLYFSAQVNSVPIPPTVWLLGAGLVLVGFLRKRVL